jgi:hypothetical protein
MDTLEEGHRSLSRQVSDNTRITQSIKSDTREILEVFQTVKGGYKFFEAISKLAKPFVWIVGPVAAGYASWIGAKVWLAEHLARLFK